MLTMLLLAGPAAAWSPVHTNCMQANLSGKIVGPGYQHALLTSLAQHSGAAGQVATRCVAAASAR